MAPWSPPGIPHSLKIRGWTVSFFSKRERHIDEIRSLRKAIVEAPGLVLIPREHHPFVSLWITVTKVIVEEAVPMGEDGVDGKIGSDLLDIKVLLNELPLFLSLGLAQSGHEF